MVIFYVQQKVWREKRAILVHYQTYYVLIKRLLYSIEQKIVDAGFSVIILTTNKNSSKNTSVDRSVKNVVRVFSAPLALGSIACGRAPSIRRAYGLIIKLARRDGEERDTARDEKRTRTEDTQYAPCEYDTASCSPRRPDRTPWKTYVRAAGSRTVPAARRIIFLHSRTRGQKATGAGDVDAGRTRENERLPFLRPHDDGDDATVTAARVRSGHGTSSPARVTGHRRRLRSSFLRSATGFQSSGPYKQVRGNDNCYYRCFHTGLRLSSTVYSFVFFLSIFCPPLPPCLTVSSTLLRRRRQCRLYTHPPAARIPFRVDFIFPTLESHHLKTIWPSLSSPRTHTAPRTTPITRSSPSRRITQ